MRSCVAHRVNLYMDTFLFFIVLIKELTLRIGSVIYYNVHSGARNDMNNIIRSYIMLRLENATLLHTVKLRWCLLGLCFCFQREE